MAGNTYEIDANISALYTYSLLCKYQSVFNPIAVKRNTYIDSHWAGCAGGDFNGDGLEEFVTVRNKDGALEIFNLESNNIITQKASIVNHPNNWAGVASGKIHNINGEVIFAVNNADNSIYAYQYDGLTVGQIGGITTAYNDNSAIAVGDLIDANEASEIAVLKENGLVSFYKYMNGQITLIVNEQTNLGSAVGITIGEFDSDHAGNEIAIINNSNGHLNIYTLDNSNGYALQLINSFTATNGTYNDWNGLSSGDFDNDGIDEIIAHRNYDGDFFVFKITNGQLQNNYTECFPTNTQHGVMGTMKYKGKDALLALRNYDGNMFMFTLDGYCPGLDLTSDINEYNSIDNSYENIKNQYPIDYHSDNTLAASNMTIGPLYYSNNEKVQTKFVSGKEVIFKTGFIVKPGAVMDAYIDNVNFGCDNNFNLKMAHQPNNLQANSQTQYNENLPKENKSTIEKKEAVPLIMRINPNPNDGIFNIQLNKPINQGKVIIYDCLSKPVATYNTSNNSSFEIDISNQAKGIYLVQFITDEYSSTKRIVKN